MRQLRSRPPVGRKARETTRIYPNGECVVFRERISRLKPVPKPVPKTKPAQLFKVARAFLRLADDPLHKERQGWFVVALFMGLSLVRNFDICRNPLLVGTPAEIREAELIARQVGHRSFYEVPPVVKVRPRYGLNGITRRGARTVRCAAHLLQKTYGRGRLTFATVTVPDMPMQQLSRLHEHWSHAVEYYRLAIRRDLQKQGLRGELLSVSEIQTERHKKTNIPVLHLHSIWVGRLPYGGWAVSTERHDQVWRAAVKSVVPDVRVSFKAAANLQEIRTSASGYLGKYMTKGAATVNLLREQGFEKWLPRQWWNASRSLTEWVKAETVESQDPSDFLLSAARSNDKSVWEFYAEVGIDIGWSQHYWLASYGRLSAPIADGLRRALGWKEQRRSERSGLAFVT